MTFRDRVFPEVEVDAVVLFAGQGIMERPLLPDWGNRIGLLDVHQRSALSPAAERRSSGRWTSFLADSDTVKFLGELRQHPAVRKFGEVATVGVGVVTGADRFFLLSSAQVAAHRIPQSHRVPAITTLKDIQGIEIRRKDWLDLNRRGKPTWLFSCNTPIERLSRRWVVEYITNGELEGHHLSFKCRTRRLWHQLSIPAPSDGFLTYMIGTAPRLVLNTACVQSTNLAHRVSFHPTVPSPRALASSFLSTVTQISAEIEGRSYGGGVLKLEPSDARELAVVLPEGPVAHDLDNAFPAIDSLIRDGRIDRAGEIVDEIVLTSHLGLSMQAVSQLRRELDRLRSRRQSR